MNDSAIILTNPLR